MKFLGSVKRHKCFWPTAGAVFLLTGFRLFADMKMSLDCIFSGLLALTGFVFTARTFITFKLNEDIYGRPSYRSYVEELQKDGAYDKQLYDPLRQLDESLGTATYMCLWATAMFLVVAFVPRPEEIKIDDTHTVTGVLALLTDWDLAKTAMTNADRLTPFVGKALMDISMTYFIFCLYQMIVTTKAIHENIQDIISHWETDYLKNRDQPANKDKP